MNRTKSPQTAVGLRRLFQCWTGSRGITRRLIIGVVILAATGACTVEGPGSLPEPARPKVTSFENPCPGAAWAAAATEPFLLPDQPDLDEACVKSAVPPGGGQVQIDFELGASGSIASVRLRGNLSTAATACLNKWASSLFFIGAHDCEGRAVPSRTSIVVGHTEGGVVS